MDGTEWDMALLANDITIRPRDRKVKTSPKILLFEDFEQKRVELADTVLASKRGWKICTWRSVSQGWKVDRTASSFI